MKKIFKLLSFVVLFVGATTLLNAQVTTSSLGGTVKDSKGIALGGATVKAVHVPSGSMYYNYVQNNGRYSIENMRAGGPYTVEVTFIGYKTNTTQNVRLMLGDETEVNIVLEDDAIELSGAVVSATASKENVQQAGMGKSFSVREITEVPTITRSLNDVIALMPQAHISSSGANIGGGNYRQSFVTVDGAAFNNAFGIGQNLPASGSPISLDALEQISVNITPYDVRQSGFTGGSINAVTRSGDNEIRGSAYFYYNNESLKGNKVGDVKFDKSESKYQLFGFRLGGPIIKNKLFFFVSYEQEESITPGPSRVAATTANPYTDGSNNVARPTETQMNTMRDHLISTYGYDPGGYQGYSSENPGHKLTARLDWNISKDHKFNIRYTDTKSKYVTAPSTSSSGLALTSGWSVNNRQAMTAMYFQNARYYQEQNFKSYAGELNSRFFGGKVSNLLRVSYSHQDEPRSTDGSEFPFVDIVQDDSGTKNILTSFGTELFSYGNLRDVETWNITDEISFQLGGHKFLAGFQYEANTTINGFQRFGAGYYQYNSWDDFATGKKANQFAITHSFNADHSQSFPTFKYNQLSFYLQDEFTIDEVLKVTLGLRAELPKYPSLDTYNDKIAATDLGTSNVNSDETTRYSTSQLPKNRVMWSPRMGFSLDLLKNKSLMLRGGTGIFTGRIPFVWIVAQAGDAGVLQNTYISSTPAGIPSFHVSRVDMLNEIYPSGIPAVGASLPASATLIDPNLKMPQTWKTFLALDAKLPNKLNLSVEGIYSKDINPAVVLNVGLKPGVSTAIPNYADNRLVYGPNYNSTLKNPYLLTNSKNGGNYYSLTLKADKQFDFGLNASIAYTYSEAKNVTDGVGDQVASAFTTPNTVNGANQQELGYASYVMPHRVIATVSYRKEYLKHFATAVSLTYEGGPRGRLSYTYTARTLNDNGANSLIYVPATKDELDFADYTYRDASNATITYTAAEQREDFWNFVNSNKYLKDRKGQYAQRNGLVYPWTNNFDLKITQDFFVNVGGKRNTIQFGLDILNVGNLLNSKWGERNYYTQASILRQTNTLTQGGTTRPIYNFMRHGTGVLKDSFVDNIGFSSTYSMQFSIRYIFN